MLQAVLDDIRQFRVRSFGLHYRIIIFWMSCFGCFPEANRSLCSQLVYHDFGRGRFSHLFKLDIQGLKVTNCNVQVLFKTRAILQQKVLFLLLFSAVLPIQMIKALGERETPS